MTSYQETTDYVLQKLQTDSVQGLNDLQVSERLTTYGENRLQEKKKKTMFARFLEQFKDVMILILIAAAIVSFTIVVVEKNWGELFEPGLILLIVILNAIMGVYQEGKAEKALDDALLMDDVAVILMTETLMKLCYDKIYDIKLHRKQPLIIEIPDRHGNGRTKDSITKYVQDAIGVKI